MAKRWLKKYMSIQHLESWFQAGGIYLADPTMWKDKNDIFAMKKYQELNRISNSRVACLTAGPDRFHFWYVFGKKHCGICLWFDFTIIDDLKKDSSIIAKWVQYRSLKWLSVNGKGDEIPFYKRQQYADEREFRILKNYDLPLSNQSVYASIDKAKLKGIYLNPWLDDKELKTTRDRIHALSEKYGYRPQLKQNKSINHKGWQNQINFIL